MKKVDLMIFDFDGTLADTRMDLCDAVNFTLEKMGLPPRKQEEIIAFVGDGIAELIKRALGEKNLNSYPEAMKIFTGYYQEHLLDSTVLYPGVQEALSYFSRRRKVVMTNKRHDYAVAIAKGLGIEKHFLEIIGDGSTPYKKPDKRLVEDLLHSYGCSREKVIVIGDGMNDVILAKNSGVASCVFLNGLGSRKKLIKAEADYYCERLFEISALFD